MLNNKSIHFKFKHDQSAILEDARCDELEETHIMDDTGYALDVECDQVMYI